LKIGRVDLTKILFFVYLYFFLAKLLFAAGFEIVQIYDETFKKSESSRIIHAQAIMKN
jgi:hypothetical protein